MEYILTASGLNKKYRHSDALNQFSIHIPKGSIYGFVGENGAGKTTLSALYADCRNPLPGTTLYTV